MSDSVGRMLERTRHSLGRSLSEAEEATKIRAKRLEALEKGDYDSLPSPAYVRGYISSYAKFLGLDTAPLLEAYDRETGTLRPEPVRPREPVVPSRSYSHHIPFGTALAIVAAIIVISGAIWGIGRLVSGPEAPPPIPVVPEATATVDPDSDASTGPGVSDDEEPEEPSEPDEPGAVSGPFTVRVVVASDSASWIRVTIDDLVAYEGTMAGGQSEEWTADASAVLRIGRAPAVTVYQDGVELEIPPGDPPVLELPVQP